MKKAEWQKPLDEQYCGNCGKILSNTAKWHRERDIVLKGEGKSKRASDYADLGPCKR